MYAACAGATIIITPPPMDNDFFDKIDEYQVQVVCCFPAMLTRISLVLEETGRQMASVKKVLCAAASIPRKVGERILRHLNLTDFKNCLGCSEGLSPYCVPPPGETAFECVGFPSSNVRIKVVDPDSGRALGPGEHGEIWVQTPSATPGYVLHDGQLQRVVDDNGWLHTGDIGYYNQDGRFFVVERLKSIIKCRDYRVFPHELEAILNTHPAVIEACVVGIPDDEVTEAPTAFVVRSKNDHGEPLVTEEELVDLVASDIGYYNQDGRFFVVERLKSIIKCRDYRVFPHELEAILNTHPAVIEACVVGIPDDEVTEAPTAFVVRSKNDHGEPLVTEEELVDLVATSSYAPGREQGQNVPSGRYGAAHSESGGAIK
ncbi:luciferin 4-monooxygenase-like [Rhipicephalus sanguineus]|uniref:luciferin 4-monooxygenase-like n=1 Tax=Rhipicephalus sanguineus TaxID=34632 RepID=UPI0020C1BB59|nr:luciferin 4-monooxygenase-like [Rhipicephalus sanguineus]